MGEGWSDFFAMTVRPGDNLRRLLRRRGYTRQRAANLVPHNNHYFGIRRYPYSTNLRRTRSRLQAHPDGVMATAGPPINGGSDRRHELRRCTVPARSGATCLSATGVRSTRRRGSLLAQAQSRICRPIGLRRPTPRSSSRRARRDPRDRLRERRRDFQLFGKPERRGPAAARRRAVAGPRTTRRSRASWSAANPHDRPRRRSPTTSTAATRDSYSTTASAARCGVVPQHQRDDADRHDGSGFAQPARALPVGHLQRRASNAPFTDPRRTFPVALDGASPGELLELYVATIPALVTPGPRLRCCGTTCMRTKRRPRPTSPSRTTRRGPRAAGGGDPWARGKSPRAATAHHVTTPAASPTCAGRAAAQREPERAAHDHVPAPLVVRVRRRRRLRRWRRDLHRRRHDVDRLGASCVPGYTGTLYNASGNPIGGRAWTKASAGYPTPINATLGLGIDVRGQTVRLRFRHAADAGVGAPGWWIDNIAASGVTNVPFLSGSWPRPSSARARRGRRAADLQVAPRDHRF